MQLHEFAIPKNIKVTPTHSGPNVQVMYENVNVSVRKAISNPEMQFYSAKSERFDTCGIIETFVG